MVKASVGTATCKWACRYASLVLVTMVPFMCLGAVLSFVPTGLLASWVGEVLASVPDHRLRTLSSMWWSKDQFQSVPPAGKWAFHWWHSILGVVANTAFIIASGYAWRGRQHCLRVRVLALLAINIAGQLAFIQIEGAYLQADSCACSGAFQAVPSPALVRLFLNAPVLFSICPPGITFKEAVAACIVLPIVAGSLTPILTQIFKLHFRTESVAQRFLLQLLNSIVFRTAIGEAAIAVIRYLPSHTEEVLVVVSTCASAGTLSASYMFQAGAATLWQTLITNIFIAIAGVIRNTLLLCGETELRLCRKLFIRVFRAVWTELSATSPVDATQSRAPTGSMPLPNTVPPEELRRRATYAQMAAAYNEMEIVIVVTVAGLFLVGKINIDSPGAAPTSPIAVLVHCSISLGFQFLSDFLTVFFAGRWLQDVAVNEGYRLTTNYDWYLRCLVGTVSVCLTATINARMIGLLCAHVDDHNRFVSVGTCASPRASALAS